MREDFLLSGFGGQGVMFAGQLLAYAAMDEGHQVTWIPSYGPEMRGGTAHCVVTISDKPIGSPLTSTPQAALVFNNPSFEKYEMQVTLGGLLVLNSTLITRNSTRSDITLLPIPATTMADQLGNLKLTNVIMLAAAVTARPVISVDAIKHAIEQHMPQHRRDLLTLNLQAIDQGAQFCEHLRV